MAECETCCGFGGTFSIKFGEISTRLADNKCQHIAASGADAVVLGDLGCMLNIEGRLRRRGDTKTRVLHVAEVLAGIERGRLKARHADRVDALQGARARQDGRRAAAGQPAEDPGQVRRQAPRVAARARRFRGDARGSRGDPPARARQPRRLARDLRAQCHRARRDGAVGGDAGRRQRARARHRRDATASARSSSRNRWSARSRRSTTRSRPPG